MAADETTELRDQHHGASEPSVGSQHLPLRHAVHSELRRQIIVGELAQGERLLEDQIAAELGVSRNPVREALQALAQDGFVELLPRRGARVAIVSAHRAAELFEVRQVLEGLVARLAASRRDEHQLVTLHRLVARGLSAARTHDTVALPALNTEFHRALAATAANDILTDTLTHLADLIEWVYASRIARRGEQSWLEHARIVGAIAAGDGPAAERLARAHIANARSAYVMTLVER